MRKIRKYLILSLAACMTLSPLAVKADNDLEKKEIIPISVPIEVQQPKYINFEGKITEINDGENTFSIRVMSDETDPYNGMVFHINDGVILLNDETKDFVSKDTLKKGDLISAYYGKDTMMMLSMPPQLSPDVIVVKESKEFSAIKVDKFDKDLLSSDGSLKINQSDNTIIVDKDGNKLKKEDILNKDLIIFYSIVLESYPAQTTPEKIIVIDKEVEAIDNIEIKILDKMIIEEKEITLEKSLYENEEGVMMIPLRQIAETLGYEVIWNNEARSVELIKGPQWSLVTIGKDQYNFARMSIKLHTAPVIKDSTTYVPYDFLNEALRVNVEITDDGKIEILK